MQDDEEIENRSSLLCKLDVSTSSLREGVRSLIISQSVCAILW